LEWLKNFKNGGSVGTQMEWIISISMI